MAKATYEIQRSVGPFEYEKLTVELDGDAAKDVFKKLASGAGYAKAKPETARHERPSAGGYGGQKSGGYGGGYKAKGYGAPKKEYPPADLDAPYVVSLSKLEEDDFRAGQSALRDAGYNYNKDDRLWYGHSLPDLKACPFLKAKFVKQLAEEPATQADAAYDDDDIPF